MNADRTRGTELISSYFSSLTSCRTRPFCTNRCHDSIQRVRGRESQGSRRSARWSNGGRAYICFQTMNSESPLSRPSYNYHYRGHARPKHRLNASNPYSPPFIFHQLRDSSACIRLRVGCAAFNGEYLSMLLNILIYEDNRSIDVH